MENPASAPPSPYLIPLILLLFPICFAAMWTFVCFLVSLGGWRALAARYKTDAPFAGNILRMRSAVFGWMTNYNGVLQPGANAQGLYLSVLFFFRVAHPPLFIPWEDIGVRQRKRLFSSGIVFTFAKAPSVTLRVSRRLGEDLLRDAGRMELLAPA